MSGNDVSRRSASHWRTMYRIASTVIAVTPTGMKDVLLALTGNRHRSSPTVNHEVPAAGGPTMIRSRLVLIDQQLSCDGRPPDRGAG